ncbi:MAG: HDOD domain-containing protein [Gammaproteobacteria bacterium]|nr:HDOD domain-containing protein [Gammaproteobacteria bacterium]
MQSLTAHALIDDVSALISLPEVVQRLNQTINDEHASAQDIARIIAHDPGLATRLLKIANSPLYGSSRQIDNVARAVTLLGTKQIRDLAYSAIASKMFAGMPSEIISVEDFWHHSLYCGLLARSLAQITANSNPDTLFTAGLLHDIGQLILFHRTPQHAHQVILLTIQGDADKDMVGAEREVLGFDHTDVGAELAQQWHLPAVLRECIAYHHTPDKAKQFPLEVAIIYIANLIASLPYSEFPDASDLQRINPVPLARLNLTPAMLTEAAQQAQAQIAQTQQALFN